jgi:pyruvate formate lyase activating enzyme
MDSSAVARRPVSTAAKRGLVFNIQKFSLHDGSGIRTLVFLQGCPLACQWCSNPEGQARSPVLAFDANKCIGVTECERCVPACGPGAIAPTQDGKAQVDRKRCTDCGDCVGACPSAALELLGRSMSVEEVLEAVEEDSGFYARSGGGLTVSGGEPLAQAEFAVGLLEAAQRRGIDTALETCGHGRWEDLRALCEHADQVFYDVKCADSARHRAHVKVGNRWILENLRRLCEERPDLAIVVRTPIVPGFNDSPEDVTAIARLLRGLPGLHRHELLPYHRFGEAKYRRLGMPVPLPGLEAPTEQQMGRLREVCGAEGPGADLRTPMNSWQG